MNPCGVIVTYMTRQDWKGQKFWIKLRTMLFNLCLFIYQMVLMVVGTAYGKIKWDKKADFIGIAINIILIPTLYFTPTGWWIIPMSVVFLFVAVATVRGIDWRRVWRAAQASHVRLCLREMTYPQWKRSEYQKGFHPTYYEYINFGYPKAELQNWRMGMIDNKHFRYFAPTFEPSPEFIAAMIEYANKQVGKGYDDLQLISNGLHLIAWIVWPPSWGKELRIIKALNRKGGREVCSSGFTACLRWGELSFGIIMKQGTTRFFPGYSTATTSPCLAPLSKNWRERES